MSRLICGIAYNSRGNYKTKDNGKKTIAYSTWRAMLQRCYSDKFQKNNPTYVGCAVDERWHDFQDFADWYHSHPYSDKGYQLDKDLLCPKNKTYSPEACCFIPSELNKLLTNAFTIRGEYPQGVAFHKKNNKYTAQLRINGKAIYIGSFDSSDEAYRNYKASKESHVKEKALEWRDRIDDDVFEALMNWRLTN